MAKGGGVGTVVKYKIKGGHRYKTVVQYCGKNTSKAASSPPPAPASADGS